MTKGCLLVCTSQKTPEVKVSERMYSIGHKKQNSLLIHSLSRICSKSNNISGHSFFHQKLGHAMFSVFTFANSDCYLPAFSVAHIQDVIKRQKIVPV